MATKAENAVTIMNRYVSMNKHGYDQTNRWGPDYDCSSLVITVWEDNGVPVKTNGATYTGNMMPVFLKCGFKDVTSKINLATGEGLALGDVLLHTSHHTEMVTKIASNYVLISGATSNETGGVTGGKTGDQTGKEIREAPYYNYPWQYVLRFQEPMQEILLSDVKSGNRYLTRAEMQINALYIWQYLKAKGWSVNAVAAMLGNMETESGINPGIWENLQSGNLNGGFGLVQWTPASKLITWSQNVYKQHYTDIRTQLERIIWEEANGEQWIATKDYPLSFTEFKTSQQSVEILADAFLKNYERPANPDQPNRATQAREWYHYILSNDPDANEGVLNTNPIVGKRMSLVLLLAATKRRM